jgi:hypothetical protein
MVVHSPSINPQGDPDEGTAWRVGDNRREIYDGLK